MVLADAASVCGLVGASRKRALLLAELTLLLSRNNWRSPDIALHALCGLQLFQCSQPTRELYKPWLSDSRITDEMIYAMTQHSNVPGEGWKFAFMDMLKNIANVAITNGLWMEAWQAASLLLRHFGADLTKYQQEEVCSGSQCFLFSRNTGLLTPKIIELNYLKKPYLDQNIPRKKSFNFEQGSTGGSNLVFRTKLIIFGILCSCQYVFQNKK